MTDSLEGDDRPPVYHEGKNLIIRASAIGSSCLFDLVAAGQGHEPSRLPESLERAFREGHELEPVVVEILKKDHQYVFVSHQEEGNWEVVPGVIIRYHSDGIAAKGLDGSCVVEIKALSDTLWQKFVKWGMRTVFEEYPWQLSVMMWDTGLPGMWAGFNKGNREGEQSQDVGRLHLEWCADPPIPKQNIIDKALYIKELVYGEDILTSGQECNDPDHWPCRYLHLRPSFEDKNSIADTDDIKLHGAEADEINHLVREYLSFKGQCDEARRRYEHARDQIIEKVGDGKRIVTDKWIVPVYEGSGASRLDYASMGEDLREEVELFRVEGKKYRYLRGIKRRD